MSTFKKYLDHGQLSVDEAIELINSDSRDNPVVNLDGMMAAIKFLQKNKTFRIPLIKWDVPTNPRFRPDFREYESKYVIPETEFERASIEHAIVTKFAEARGEDIDIDNKMVHGVSTVIDGENDGRPVIEAPKTKFGEGLNTSTISTHSK